ncbi:MAG: type II secretion system protein F [Lachnospiraceae bacterium]|nr:type II secretion system protein F [Lachnospiraceae bacterium]
MKKESFLDLLKGILLILIFSWLFYDSLLAVFCLLPLLRLWLGECREEREQKAKEQFRKMFREWILLLSSSLSAGYSVENAMGQSFRELQMMFPKGGIMLDELKEMLAKAENNQRPEALLGEFAQRHPLEEVKSFVEVFCTARISGGSLNAVIQNTASQMAEIMDTRREIGTLLAAKVYEQKIMTVMPAAVLLYVRIGSGEFLKGLYHNPMGILVATVCLVIYLSAYLLGKRMVQFEI